MKTNSYATDSYGFVYHIRNATNGVKYYCPACNKEMILKKGKRVKSYFSHKKGKCAASGSRFPKSTVITDLMTENISYFLTRHFNIQIADKIGKLNYHHIIHLYSLINEINERSIQISIDKMNFEDYRTIYDSLLSILYDNN